MAVWQARRKPWPRWRVLLSTAFAGPRTRRSVALRLLAALAAAAVAATGATLAMSQASAQVSGSATGYATQNGGTTGGTGGQTVRATTGTQINAALCNRASSSTPIIIEVEGTINHGNTSDVSGDSCDVTDDLIDLKRISNVSIVGVGGGAVFDQLGIHIRESSNIIIQNVTIRNVKKSGSPTSNGGDAIGMEADVRNVWVDHVTLEASGGEDDGYDGLFDMKNDTKYVTLSYSILRNSGRGGLIGSSESDRANSFITFHHNLYQNIDSRTPLLRGGTGHMFNNHYVGLVKSGINSRAGAQAKVENNYFQDSNDVLGTFYTNERGTWQVSGNIYDNVTWSSEGDENYPAGPNPQSTTSVSVPYSYDLDGASCVPDVVNQTAGANKGLRVSDGSCTPQSPPPPSPPPGSPPPPPTCTPEPTDPSGTNLSIGAGSDGSSKASGTSYGDVRDGDMNTYWSPSGSTGRISIKWDSNTTVSSVNIREASGAGGNIGSWRLYNHDTGATLATGSGAGMISFASTSLRKISFEITGSNGTPQVAEFETYAGSTTQPAPTCQPTPPPPSSPPPPPDQVRYEAEDAPATCDGSIDSDHSGHSGSGFCNTDNSSGTASTFVVDTSEGGSATVDIRYANGSSENRAANISVNGSVAVSDHPLPGTGAWNSWNTTTVTLPLASGSNTIGLTATTSGGLANIDYIDVEGGGTQPPPSPPPPPPPGGTLYVAPNGGDSASGTESDPTTLTSAINRVEPGGRIYLRGGTYRFSETVHIEPGNDGSSGNRKELFAYPGETPVLNFAAQSEDSANRGLAIGGHWWHIHGIVVERAGDNGVLLGGNDNIIERVVTRYNRDTGLQLSRYTAGAPRETWPSNNLILSSVSHDNADSDGEDADGFAPKLTVGPGNVFRYTVSHNNIDDGYDLYTKDDTGAIGAVTIEYSLAYDNGTLSDGTQNSSGDRNGYKLGGEDIAVDHTIRGSVAYQNGKHGFTFNRNPGRMTVSDNVSIGNEERNFNFDGGSSVFRNNTSCDSGSTDRYSGDADGSNQFWDGSNGSRCSSYSGSLSWSFASDGTLVVTIGGTQVIP